MVDAKTMRDRANEATQWVDVIMRDTNNNTRYTQAVMKQARQHIHLLARLLHDSTAGVPVLRVLDAADAFCPKCGHNRDRSSVSSIDHGSHQSCQLCGAEWREAADGVQEGGNGR